MNEAIPKSAIPKSGDGDEIDQKIDEALDRVGMFLGFWIRVLLFIGLVSGLLWVIFYSRYAPTLAPIFSSAIMPSTRSFKGAQRD